MKHIDGFGVNIKEFEKFMLMKQWFSRCMEKAAKTEKPFRAILEYNPKRRHMAIFSVEEINEDGHTDELGKSQGYDNAAEVHS